MNAVISHLATGISWQSFRIFSILTFKIFFYYAANSLKSASSHGRLFPPSETKVPAKHVCFHLISYNWRSNEKMMELFGIYGEFSIYAHFVRP